MLAIVLAALLPAPGVLGCHLHEDGTCHAHPFDEHEDGDADHPIPLPAEHRHSAADSDCRPVWLSDNARPEFPGPHPEWLNLPAFTELDPPNIRAPARALPPYECESTPLFIRQRCLLI
jgi:hypothetical protein